MCSRISRFGIRTAAISGYDLVRGVGEYTIYRLIQGHSIVKRRPEVRHHICHHLNQSFLNILVISLFRTFSLTGGKRER